MDWWKLAAKWTQDSKTEREWEKEKKYPNKFLYHHFHIFVIFLFFFFSFENSVAISEEGEEKLQERHQKSMREQQSRINNKNQLA